jgi:hypothetical protein
VRTLIVTNCWGLKHDLGRAAIDRRSHQPHRLRIVAWIGGRQIQNLRSVWTQPTNRRFFLAIKNQHFCRSFIDALPKNVRGTGSIRGEQHGFVVERPVEGNVVGLIERKPARCAESRSFGRKLGYINTTWGLARLNTRRFPSAVTLGFTAKPSPLVILAAIPTKRPVLKSMLDDQKFELF